MKGKSLSYEKICNLVKGTKIYIEGFLYHGIGIIKPPYITDLYNQNLILIKDIEKYLQIYNCDYIKIYKWIDEFNKITLEEIIDKAQEILYNTIHDNQNIKETYYLDEILKMIREEFLSENTILISPSQFATGSIDMFSEIPLKELKKYEPFKIYEEKEYITFDEVKKLGTPKHKEFGYDILKFNSAPQLRRFIEEMDKKVWFVED